MFADVLLSKKKKLYKALSQMQKYIYASCQKFRSDTTLLNQPLYLLILFEDTFIRKL